MPKQPIGSERDRRRLNQTALEQLIDWLEAESEGIDMDGADPSWRLSSVVHENADQVYGWIKSLREEEVDGIRSEVKALKKRIWALESVLAMLQNNYETESMRSQKRGVKKDRIKQMLKDANKRND